MLKTKVKKPDNFEDIYLNLRSLKRNENRLNIVNGDNDIRIYRFYLLTVS